MPSWASFWPPASSSLAEVASPRLEGSSARMISCWLAMLRLVVCAVLLSGALPAYAVDNPCDGTVGGPYVRWSSQTTASAALASSLAHDTGFGAAASRAYFTQGTKLLAFRNVSDAGGVA